MKSKTITLFLLLIIGITNAQEIEPLELVQKVFTDKEFAEKTDKYSVGEFKGHPNINDLPPKIKLNFRLLEKTENNAVVNITIIDSLGKGIDTYAHLEKNKNWKINAFRTLAMTGFLEKTMLEMEKMTDEQIDNLIKQDNETFNSKEDFYRELKNIKLTLALDDEMIQHFRDNKNEFEKLKNEVINSNYDKGEQSYRKIDIGKIINSDYKKLLITHISTSFNCEKCFEFVIGGMLDNTVGYLYIEDKNNLPKMNPSRLIMLREIGNGWYLFKTT